MTEPTPFEAPSQSAWMYDENGRRVGHMSLSGPTLRMPVGNRLVPFELHRYFGPVPLRKDGCLTQRVARGFWDAFEAWKASGKLVTDDDVCVIQQRKAAE